MWQAVIQLYVRCVLPLVGVLKLEGIVFVEELKVPLSWFGDGGVIGIKGQLSVQLSVPA